MSMEKVEQVSAVREVVAGAKKGGIETRISLQRKTL